jgi:hypothetical protein
MIFSVLLLFPFSYAQMFFSTLFSQALSILVSSPDQHTTGSTFIGFYIFSFRFLGRAKKKRDISEENLVLRQLSWDMASWNTEGRKAIR